MFRLVVTRLDLRFHVWTRGSTFRLVVPKTTYLLYKNIIIFVLKSDMIVQCLSMWNEKVPSSKFSSHPSTPLVSLFLSFAVRKFLKSLNLSHSWLISIPRIFHQLPFFLHPIRSVITPSVPENRVVQTVLLMERLLSMETAACRRRRAH